MSLKKYIIAAVSLLAIAAVPGVAQVNPSPAGSDGDFSALMQKNDFKGALKILLPKIENIHGTRVDEKRVPSDFITLGGSDSEGLSKVKMLNKMFRERKVSPFFIEDNKELFLLHRAAGKCLYETNVLDDALNHYYQSLRFHQPKPEEDDSVFWEIAQVYLKKKQMPAYCATLEAAADLNPGKSLYSLELGKALYRTKDRKKAIYYLERYRVSQGEELKELDVLLMLAGLSEGVGRFLDAQKCYQQYLSARAGDGYIHFALGDIAFHNTGNYPLAISELRKAIELLPQTEIYRKAKAYEYIGDMFFATLKYDLAEEAYLQTITFQNLVLAEIKKNDDEIARINTEIRNLKSSLLKEKNYVQYNEYQFQMQEKERVLTERKEKKYEYDKLNPGKCRWNIAETYEKREMFEKGIEYYRQVISFNYQTNEAREKIIKIQLKIKRGY